VPFELSTYVAAQQDRAAGDVLGFAVTKSGTGVQLPIGQLIVEVEKL
jgi:hypothetical protein